MNFGVVITIMVLFLAMSAYLPPSQTCGSVHSVCRMSEPTVAPLDPGKRKTKTFSKQMSKTFQKGKEAMKRGLLTPRGARAQEKSSAEGPVGKSAVATPSIPKAPVPSTDPVSRVLYEYLFRSSWPLLYSHRPASSAPPFQTHSLTS